MPTAANCESSRLYLSQILQDLYEAEKYEIDSDAVEFFYNRVVNALVASADSSVPDSEKKL